MNKKIVTILLAALASVVCGDIHQDIILERDSLLRTQNADGVMELLELIEEQEILSFGGSVGPVDADAELVRTVLLCNDFFAENNMDTRWAKLSKANADDDELMQEMLKSENAGERTIAILKLHSIERQDEFIEELLYIESHDPIVYIGKMVGGNPRTYDFYAPVRELAREVLTSWSAESVDQSTFDMNIAEFGMERLIVLFSNSGPSRNGILQALYYLDKHSGGLSYLNSLDKHHKVSDEMLLLLKEHANKNLNRIGYMGEEGMALDEVLQEVSLASENATGNGNAKKSSRLSLYGLYLFSITAVISLFAGGIWWWNNRKQGSE